MTNIEVDRGNQPNPAGVTRPLLALRTVILWTLTDAFGLVPEESLWAGYHLDRILNPLVGRPTSLVSLAVRQEMLTGVYTRQLDMLEAGDRPASLPVHDPAAVTATPADWAAVLLDVIESCYPMRPMDQSAIAGQIIGLLRELGVGDPHNPRGARYLPTDVRHRLTRSENASSRMNNR